MNLFVDTISAPAHIIFFDENKKIIDEYTWSIKWKESSTLIPKIDDFLRKHKLEYKNLENIIVVNGPWSFTGVRTTVLVMNTINYIIKKNLIPISFFDLFHQYPIIKASSKRDCFIQREKNNKIEIMKNEDIFQKLEKNQIGCIYGEINSELFTSRKIVDKVDYQSIIDEIKICNWERNKRIEPLYIKKPNIS